MIITLMKYLLVLTMWVGAAVVLLATGGLL